jgi:hypothetical protein
VVTNLFAPLLLGGIHDRIQLIVRQFIQLKGIIGTFGQFITAQGINV